MMEFVSRVRDASRSSKEGRDVLVNGYHGYMVAAYAIADGIKRAFIRFGKRARTAADTVIRVLKNPAIRLLPGFAELLDIDDA